MRLATLLPLAALLAASGSPASNAAAPTREGIVVTGPGPGWIKHVPLKDRIDPRSSECTDHAARLAAVAQRDQVEIKDHRAFIDRARWESGAKADWPEIAWGMAYRSSCNAGARGTHTLTMFDRDESVRDPMKRMLAYRNVSTSLECHGDHAVMGPDDTWYQC